MTRLPLNPLGAVGKCACRKCTQTRAARWDLEFDLHRGLIAHPQCERLDRLATAVREAIRDMQVVTG